MLIEDLGVAVAGLRVSTLSRELLDQVKLHVFDSIGAAVAGARVTETLALVRILAAVESRGTALAVGPQVRLSRPYAALLSVASARCSEMDDIHLAACVTPGSVVVATALALASTQPDLTDDAFLAACLVGYETLIRFGLAIDGPHALYAGIWPTSLCAGFGAAAVTGRLLGLSATQMAHALAMVAAATPRVNPRTDGLTSRWLLVGTAAQQAVLSVVAALHGLQGDLTLLENAWARVLGVPLRAELLLADWGQTWHTEEVSAKPYSAARQTIAAVEALRGLLQDEPIDVTAIQDVLVEVPPPYRRMIDHPAPPTGRHEAISDVRYQLALLALEPASLWDAAKEVNVAPDSGLGRFWQAVRVQADPALEPLYPTRWPARVTLTTAAGRQATREVARVPGDPDDPLTWQRAAEKYALLDRPGWPAIQAACQALGTSPAGTLAALIQQLGALGA